MRNLLVWDQRSFLTGAAAVELRPVMVLPPPEEREERRRVTDLLSRQRIQHPSLETFSLKGLHNAILLEAGLQIHWEDHATIAFVPQMETCLAILDALKKSNKEWQTLYDAAVAAGDKDTKVKRPLDTSQPPFASPLWEVLVLYPQAFSVEGLPLSILRPSDRTLITLANPSPPLPPGVAHPRWDQYVAAGDRLVLASPPHTPLAPFAKVDLRPEEKRLATLAM
ncbi:hypothetical protein CVT26_004458, partial [Gymnopilus dilepis]